MSRAEPGEQRSLAICSASFLALPTSEQLDLATERTAGSKRFELRLCRDALSLFEKGVLVLDEVDTILHPLRSELNWPLGGKVPLDFTTDRGAPGMRSYYRSTPWTPSSLQQGVNVSEVENSPAAGRLTAYRYQHSGATSRRSSASHTSCP